MALRAEQAGSDGSGGRPPGASKYDGLRRLLEQRCADAEHVVDMTFVTIDALVGGLPASARRFRAWWANSSQPQAQAWQSAGWRLANVDIASERVHFVRAGTPAIRARLGTERQRRELQPAGAPVDVGVRFQWLDAGEITLNNDGRIAFPSLPSVSGIYRFTFVPLHADARPRVYIGESDSLARRAGNYRRPGLKQPTNNRLNATIADHLRAGGVVGVAIACDVTMTSDGETHVLDLSRKASRLLAENAALVLAQTSGEVEIENL